jgi:hypothetical protein
MNKMLYCNKKYITINNVLIFDNKFNECISDLCDFLNNYNTIIFTDFNTHQSTLKNYIKIYHDKHNVRYNPSQFNKPLDNLPISIKKLFLGHSFNNKLENLPTNLQILKLGYSYEQSLDYLPESIELLILENRRLSSRIN